MGTSQGSEGPTSAVSLIPPWADPDPEPPTPEPPAPPPDAVPPAEPPGEPREQLPPADQPAPERRFAAARRNLAAFARTGDSGRLHRAVAQYVHNGYGGAATAARRLGSTSTTAAALGRTLDPASPDSSLDRSLLEGRSADEVMDAVVDAARPNDGTLDAEASRDAIRNALSELLGEYNDVDLLNLTDLQREFVIERFAAHDVYRRFALDVGSHLVTSAPDATTGLARMKQARNYIRQTVAESFRRLREAGKQMTTATIRSVVAGALSDSLTVFEGYLT